jgi:hypothetical protein
MLKMTKQSHYVIENKEKLPKTNPNEGRTKPFLGRTNPFFRLEEQVFG